VDVVDEKVKEKMEEKKMEEKKKEPVFFMGVELVDLDDCDVPNRKLQCDSDDMDNDDPAAEPVQSAVPVHSDHPSEVSPFVHDPLFNAVGKAPHLDAVIVKQEASWFQLRDDCLSAATSSQKAWWQH
jgi:hypothetical protein